MIAYECKRWADRRTEKRRALPDLWRGVPKRPCALGRAEYRPGAMVEPGFVTLAKIVGTLLLCMGIIPFVFLLAPGDRSEPNETFDGD